MSGVELGVVLGLVSSIITICEAAYEIYDAANDARGLPQKLRVAADQIPLVCHALILAQQNLDVGNVNEQSLESVRPVLTRCEDDAKVLLEMFGKTIPAKDASKAERMKKAMNLQTKTGKIKKHMGEMMKGLALLGQYQLFSDASVLQDIRTAIEQLRQADEKVVARYSHSGSGDINASTNYGPTTTYQSSGSGNVYHFENSRSQGTDADL